MYILSVYAVVSAGAQLKPSVDAVAAERDAVLHEVALCCLLRIVNLPILDGIADSSGSKRLGWLPHSCCNGLKLTYENPLLTSPTPRLLFHCMMCISYH